MKNKNLFIGIGVAVVAYFIWKTNKKQVVGETHSYQAPNSPIEEKKDLGNGLSVVYDIANCNKTTSKCPIIRVIKEDKDTITTWYSEKNKYFKITGSKLMDMGSNLTEITEKQYIDEAISMLPF